MLMSLACLFVGRVAESATFGRAMDIDAPESMGKVHAVLLEQPSRSDTAAMRLRSSNAKSSFSTRTNDDGDETPQLDCHNELLSMEMKLLCHYYSQF